MLFQHLIPLVYCQDFVLHCVSNRGLGGVSCLSMDPLLLNIVSG
ncbi:hypothetical protein SynPROS91_00210 [Synechococcus sp. PROS-9-1]|nr:hypothetical protein SynPROS91_00210 [Synechococcus sp. PROS-9-1]